MTNFKVGDRVMFGRSHGEKTLGEVVKVNQKSLKVKTLEARGTKRAHRIGGVWRVPHTLCTLVTVDGKEFVDPTPTRLVKRPEAEIMRDIMGIYCALSPENLHCDGEISRTAAARKERRLRSQLRGCFAELGRKVKEGEAFEATRVGSWLDGQRKS
jgi:hypothetical protein